MINSRSLDDLHPKVKELAEKFVAGCKGQGWEILILTNAKGGQSFHNYRVAFDWVPMLHGKPLWDDEAAYLKCAEIGEALGLEWAGRWKSFKETAHLQYTNGLRLADFQAGKSF
jgi:peptidoglycan LD-endopeptidase CwlK